ISIRRVANDQELAGLPGVGLPAQAMKFSGDDRFLSAIYSVPNGGAYFQVWDLKTNEAIVKLPGGVSNYAADISADSSQSAIGLDSGAIVLYELPSGNEIKRFGSGASPHSLAYHPQGKLLAVSSLKNSLVLVLDLDAESTAATLKHPTF